MPAPSLMRAAGSSVPGFENTAQLPGPFYFERDRRAGGLFEFVDLGRRLGRFTAEQRGHSHLVLPLCSASFHPMVVASKELPEREPPSIQAVGAVSPCEASSQISSKASRASPIVTVLRPMRHP
jgi:hypothetical protein